jgi:hypothetical protein
MNEPITTSEWQQLAQDNAEALNRSQGKVRALLDREKVKDAAHKEALASLRADIVRLVEENNAVIAGQGLVSAAAHEAALARLAKAEAKTRATRIFAEAQRKRVVLLEAAAFDKAVLAEPVLVTQLTPDSGAVAASGVAPKMDTAITTGSGAVEVAGAAPVASEQAQP